jgi:hypothetical protein
LEEGNGTGKEEEQEGNGGEAPIPDPPPLVLPDPPKKRTLKPKEFNPPEGKTKYLKWVYLTDQEKEALINRFKAEGLDKNDVKRAIEHLDCWFENNQKKRFDRTDDYRALIGWPLEKVRQERITKNRLNGHGPPKPNEPKPSNGMTPAVRDLIQQAMKQKEGN